MPVKSIIADRYLIFPDRRQTGWDFFALFHNSEVFLIPAIFESPVMSPFQEPWNCSIDARRDFPRRGDSSRSQILPSSRLSRRGAAAESDGAGQRQKRRGKIEQGCARPPLRANPRGALSRKLWRSPSVKS